jgi:hypothetical protein
MIWKSNDFVVSLNELNHRDTGLGDGGCKKVRERAAYFEHLEKVPRLLLEHARGLCCSPRGLHCLESGKGTD